MKSFFEGKSLSVYVAQLPYRAVVSLFVFGWLWYARVQFPFGIYLSRSRIVEQDGSIYLEDQEWARGSCVEWLGVEKAFITVESTDEVASK